MKLIDKTITPENDIDRVAIAFLVSHEIDEENGRERASYRISFVSGPDDNGDCRVSLWSCWEGMTGNDLLLAPRVEGVVRLNITRFEGEWALSQAGLWIDTRLASETWEESAASLVPLTDRVARATGKGV